MNGLTRTNQSWIAQTAWTCVFACLLPAHAALAQDVSVAYDDVAQVSISDQSMTMSFDSDAWNAAIGSATATKTATLSDALQYTLSHRASVTAQITGVSGAASAFTGSEFDAIDSVQVTVEKGQSDGQSDITTELWTNDIAGDSPSAAKTVVQPLNPGFGRASESDFLDGLGADVTYTVTLNVEDGTLFQASVFEITFTAIGAQ